MQTSVSAQSNSIESILSATVQEQSATVQEQLHYHVSRRTIQTFKKRYQLSDAEVTLVLKASGPSPHPTDVAAYNLRARTIYGHIASLAKQGSEARKLLMSQSASPIATVPQHLMKPCLVSLIGNRAHLVFEFLLLHESTDLCVEQKHAKAFVVGCVVPPPMDTPEQSEVLFKWVMTMRAIVKAHQEHCVATLGMVIPAVHHEHMANVTKWLDERKTPAAVAPPAISSGAADRPVPPNKRFKGERPIVTVPCQAEASFDAYMAAQRAKQ